MKIRCKIPLTGIKEDDGFETCKLRVVNADISEGADELIHDSATHTTHICIWQRKEHRPDRLPTVQQYEAIKIWKPCTCNSNLLPIPPI